MMLFFHCVSFSFVCEWLCICVCAPFWCPEPCSILTVPIFFLFNFFSTYTLALTQSEETANLLYSCDWQGKTSDEKNYGGGRDHAVVVKPKPKPARFDFPCDVEAMRIIKFIIKRAQKPLILMAMKFSSLSLNTFSRVSSIIYTLTLTHTHIDISGLLFSQPSLLCSFVFVLFCVFSLLILLVICFYFCQMLLVRPVWWISFTHTRSFYHHHHHHHFAHSMSLWVCVFGWWGSFVFQFVYLFVGWIFHRFFSFSVFPRDLENDTRFSYFILARTFLDPELIIILLYTTAIAVGPRRMNSYRLWNETEWEREKKKQSWWRVCE